MEESPSKTLRQLRKENLMALAAAEDGKPTRKPGWVKRVRFIGGKLKVTVEKSPQ